MKSSILTTITLFFVATTLLGAQRAQSVDGTWTGTDGSEEVVLIAKSNGRNVSGTIQEGTRKHSMSAGNFDGRTRLNFRIETACGIAACSFIYDCNVDGDTLSVSRTQELEGRPTGNPPLKYTLRRQR